MAPVAPPSSAPLHIKHFDNIFDIIKNIRFTKFCGEDSKYTTFFKTFL